MLLQCLPSHALPAQSTCTLHSYNLREIRQDKKHGTKRIQGATPLTWVSIREHGARSLAGLASDPAAGHLLSAHLCRRDVN